MWCVSSKILITSYRVLDYRHSRQNFTDITHRRVFAPAFQELAFQRVTSTHSISHGAGVRGNCLGSAAEEMIVPRMTVKRLQQCSGLTLLPINRASAFNVLNKKRVARFLSRHRPPSVRRRPRARFLFILRVRKLHYFNASSVDKEIRMQHASRNALTERSLSRDQLFAKVDWLHRINRGNIFSH